jgi:hypothetical protein
MAWGLDGSPMRVEHRHAGAGIEEEIERAFAVDGDRNSRLSYDELDRHGGNRLRDGLRGSGTGQEEQRQ